MRFEIISCFSQHVRARIFLSFSETFRTTRTMATASKVQLSANEHPVFYLPGISEDTVKKTSELLQENHDNYHICRLFAAGLELES